MTVAEKIALKGQAVEACIDSLRHVVRHNGAAIRAKADITEIAEHALDMDPGRVKTLWTDINTIDRVKNILRSRNWLSRPELTTEELLGYAVNDDRLTAAHSSWAVVRITRTGTEILTCGGDYYQRYRTVTTTEEVSEEVLDETTGEATTVIKTVEHTAIVQEGETDLLRAELEAEEAAWMAQTWTAVLGDADRLYSEGGEEFVVIPCGLPGSLDRLISMRIGLADGNTLAYSLTDKSCDASNEGMVGLPHGIWLIYDNSSLKSAPCGLMVPRALAEDSGDGARCSRIDIVYNELVSGMARLRLVGDSFGEEYIVSTQDFTAKMKGTWRE